MLRKFQVLRRQHFSLIELLVVCAIIAVLIAITLPAITAVRRAAAKSKSASNMHQLGVALNDYDANIGKLPPGAPRWNEAVSGVGVPYTFNQTTYAPNSGNYGSTQVLRSGTTAAGTGSTAGMTFISASAYPGGSDGGVFYHLLPYIEGDKNMGSPTTQYSPSGGGGGAAGWNSYIYSTGKVNVAKQSRTAGPYNYWSYNYTYGTSTYKTGEYVKYYAAAYSTQTYDQSWRRGAGNSNNNSFTVYLAGSASGDVSIYEGPGDPTYNSGGSDVSYLANSALFDSTGPGTPIVDGATGKQVLTWTMGTPTAVPYQYYAYVLNYSTYQWSYKLVTTTTTPYGQYYSVSSNYYFQHAYSYSYSYYYGNTAPAVVGSKNGPYQTTTYSHTYSYPYQVQNIANGTTSTPVGNPVASKSYISYTLGNIPDGTSNTMCFAEGYTGPCSGSTSTSSTSGGTTYMTYSYAYRYGRFNLGASGISSYAYSYSYYKTKVSAYNQTLGASFNLVPGKTFEVVPPKNNCNAFLPQGNFRGGIMVTMCDGSVHFVNQNVSVASWQAAMTPADGLVPGSDW